MSATYGQLIGKINSDFGSSERYQREEIERIKHLQYLAMAQQNQLPQFAMPNESFSELQKPAKVSQPAPNKVLLLLED